MTKIDATGELISRGYGATSWEIMQGARTTSPSKRLSELREKGWDIVKLPVHGTNYHRFYGTPPQGVAHG